MFSYHVQKETPVYKVWLATWINSNFFSCLEVVRVLQVSEDWVAWHQEVQVLEVHLEVDQMKVKHLSQ